MINSNDDKLRDCLIKNGLISRDLFSKAEAEARSERMSVIETLVKRNYLGFTAIQSVCSEVLDRPLIDVLGYSVEEDVLHIISENLMRRHVIFPLKLEDKKLSVAMADPWNIMVIDDLKVITGFKIIPFLALGFQIMARIDSASNTSEVEIDSRSELAAILSEATDDLELIEQQEESLNDLIRGTEETPVIKITNKILIDSVKRGASDIFIEPWEKMMRIRCRVDGLLEEIKAPPKSMAGSLVSRIKVMSNLDIAERRLPQDGRFKIKYQSREVDFRVSVLPTSFGEKICLRILDKTAQAQSVDKLGFLDTELERIKACAEKPHGMILVTGPTGSGKTSTLYSILNYIDSPEKNITTVEDPVEYMMQGINQVNCREDVGLTFSSSLRSILRQDPDVIMIGEIRDFETMDIAIKAALTGHLVLSTLHTNDAISSITRMINMGIEPFLISSSVLMISAQRLVRRLCLDCRRPFDPGNDILRQNGLETLETHTFFQCVGCSSCRETGYKGRTVITEVFCLTEEIRNLIVAKATADELRVVAKKAGMRSLREAALIKASQGITTLDEVFRVTATEPVKGKA